MKRRVIQLGVLVLAGAIVNVAVAWGCTFRRQSLQKSIASTTNSAMLVIDWHVKPYDYDNWVEANRKTTHELHTQRTVSCHGLQIEQFEAGILLYPNSSAFATCIVERVSSGWPLLAVYGGRWEVYRWNEITKTEQRIEVMPITALLPHIDGLTRLLPVKPTWPGFAINTIFYAGILGMMFTLPGAIRRSMRRRRGLCAKCAYPIGESPVCSECGAAVK